MKIKAIEMVQNGKKMYVSVMKAKDLIEHCKVDVFDISTGKGYQRELSKQRIRDFSAYVREAFKISPLSILISIRREELVYDNEHLEIPEDETWWVVDGQHRVEGLRDAIEKDKQIENYEVPTVIVPFKDVYEEALQFLIINRTQKPVRTDLAERILLEASKKAGFETLIEIREKGALKRVLGGVEWRVRAIELADFLNRDDKSVWYQKIKMPNVRSKSAVIAQRSFTESLEPIVTHPTFGILPQTTIAIALRNYWEAISEIYPEAFENPKSYIIQKTTGAYVFHKLFPVVLSKTLDEKGNYRLTKERIKEILLMMDKKYQESEEWRSSDVKHGIEGGYFGRMGTSKKTFNIIYEMIARSIESKWEEEQPEKPGVILE